MSLHPKIPFESSENYSFSKAKTSKFKPLSYVVNLQIQTRALCISSALSASSPAQKCPLMPSRAHPTHQPTEITRHTINPTKAVASWKCTNYTLPITVAPEV
eukprot:gene3292-2274_t